MSSLASEIKQVVREIISVDPLIVSVERYVIKGDEKELQRIKPSAVQRYDRLYGERLLRWLNPVARWDEVDRRLIRALGASGQQESVWEWLVKHIAEEPEGGDWVVACLAELNVGKLQANPILDFARLVQHYELKGRLNSFGRYVIGQTNESIATQLKLAAQLDRYIQREKPASLFVEWQFDRAVKLTPEFLTYNGRSNLDSFAAGVLLKKDAGTFGPIIVQLLKLNKDTNNVFNMAEVLYEADSKTYRELAIAATRAGLAGDAENNNHDQMVEFLIKVMGKGATEDVRGAIRRNPNANSILRTVCAAAEGLGAEFLPEALEKLKGLNEIIFAPLRADEGSGPTYRRYKSGYRERKRLLALLIAINDGAWTHEIEAIIQPALAYTESEIVVDDLGIASRVVSPVLQETAWKLLEHKSRRVRVAASRAVAIQTGVSMERLKGLLVHKKADVRGSATMVLCAVGTPTSLAMLEDRLDHERNDDVRDQMLTGLEKAWAEQGRQTTRQDIAGRALRANEKLKAPVVPWLDAEKLPGMKWSDGGKVDAQTVKYLIYRQSRCKEMKADIEARPLYAMIDRRSSGAFAHAVLNGFLQSEQDSKDRWAMVLACRLGDDALVAALSAQIRQWVDNNRPKTAEYGVKALSGKRD